MRWRVWSLEDSSANGATRVRRGLDIRRRRARVCRREGACWRTDVGREREGDEGDSASGDDSWMREEERVALVAVVASGAEVGVWVRRRLVVVGREDASCQPVGDTGRSADGGVMRRRVGTLGAEVDAGVEVRRRLDAGAAEAEEGMAEDVGAGAGAGGYW